MKKVLVSLMVLTGVIIGGETVTSVSASANSFNENSIVDYLYSQGEDFSFEYREELAEKYGITNYEGTAKQNLTLLDELQENNGSETVVTGVSTVNQEQESNTMTVEATAYTAGVESTGKNPSDDGYGITASGTVVEEGRTLACGQYFDIGTHIYIPIMGSTYICEDRGGAVTGIDIYMDSVKDAREFGRKNVEVTILD